MVAEAEAWAGYEMVAEAECPSLAWMAGHRFTRIYEDGYELVAWPAGDAQTRFLRLYDQLGGKP